MSTTRITNKISVIQTIRNTFTMAYRGLLKIKRTPEQLIDVTMQPIIFTIARIAPLAGALLTDTVRYTIATVIIFLMGFFIGYRPTGGWENIVLAAILVIICALVC